jgi:hypothetical protein
VAIEIVDVPEPYAGRPERERSDIPIKNHRSAAIEAPALPGGLRFDLAGLRQPASSACASAISGISGVGEKPSSAGARTA